MYQPQGPQEPTDPFVKGLQGGLQAGLGDTLNNYFEEKKRGAEMAGASDILSQLPENYALEDVLNEGRRVGAKSGSIQMALNLAQTSRQIKDRQQTHQDQQEKERQNDPLYKAASKDFSSMVSGAKKMGELSQKADALEALIKGGAQTNISHLTEIVGRDSMIGRTLQLFEGDKAGAFNVLGKSFLEYFKTTFPTRFTDKDLLYVQSAVPSLARKESQNLETLAVYKAMAKKYQEEVKIAHRIVRENNGIVPIDLNEQIDREIAPMEEAIEQLKIQSSPQYAQMTGKDVGVKPGFTSVVLNGQQAQIPSDQIEAFKTKHPTAKIGS